MTRAFPDGSVRESRAAGSRDLRDTEQRSLREYRDGRHRHERSGCGAFGLITASGQSSSFSADEGVNDAVPGRTTTIQNVERCDRPMQPDC
jgi:hypothetical protein